MVSEKLDQAILKEIRYFVLPASHNDFHLDPQQKELLSRLREYWMEFWTNLYKSLGGSDVPNFEEFDRQDKITALMYKNSVVGMHLLKGYTPDDFTTHPYFQPYDTSFFAGLRARRVRRIQSLQYFMVDPKWSRKNTGVNFGAVIAALSLKQHVKNGFDASITIARRDISVTDTAKKFGFIELSESTKLHCVPVSLVACFQPTPFPEEDVNKLADYFWSTRIDVTETTTDIKKAG